MPPAAPGDPRAMKVALYAAVARNGVIGRQGGLPWRLHSDLQRFKRETMGKPVIMGRKTFDAIGRALPGRYNIVVTHDIKWHAPGAATTPSFSRALLLARTSGSHMQNADEIVIAGGGEIYRQAMPVADILHITHVLADIEDGDAFFPPIESSVWRPTATANVAAGPMDTHPTRYVVYERLRPR